MSAALVESVRALVANGYTELRVGSGILDPEHWPGDGGLSLDLPAILAALTEVEALRAQVAAGQAREVALRKLAAYMAEDVCQCDENLGTQCASCFARDYLSAPTDTAALRAMLEKAAGMGMSCGYSRCCSKLEAKSDADRNEIVDRALGGS